MILGDQAIFLNLLSIYGYWMIFLIILISSFIKMKVIDIKNYSATSRLSILWFIVTSPWIISLLVSILVLFSDSKYLQLPDAIDFFHWHHPEEFLFNSWHEIGRAHV